MRKEKREREKQKDKDRQRDMKKRQRRGKTDRKKMAEEKKVDMIVFNTVSLSIFTLFQCFIIMSGSGCET